METTGEPEPEPGGETARERRDSAMRRPVSRRSLLTDELSRASLQMARQLPSLGPLLGFALKESAAQRDRRLVRQLWPLVLGREAKPDESAAGLEMIRKAPTPEEKGDALVDVLWALCQTVEFEQANRPPENLVGGLYRLALRRDPSEAEATAARDILREAAEPAATIAALEGLFTGLLRSSESVLRQNPGSR
jgi:hypothetical protein